jgi:acyl-CoA synthetase (AMP-forming)/AMP-acid ligase II
MAMEKSYIMSMDAGGTMTDTFFVDKSGRFVVGKAQTTPQDESVGFAQSCVDALKQWDTKPEDIFPQVQTGIYSGTSMLNRLLERKGQRLGVIVTAGQEDYFRLERGILPRFASSPLEKKFKQGHGLFGVQMRISNDHHPHCPWGDEHVGALQVRGPYVISGYFKQEGKGTVDADGWFNTGDIASIDTDGYLKIVDREKDLVKSGGEWISSIEVENTASSYPGAREAAVIVVPHDRWGERPVLLVVRADNADVDPDHLMAFLGPARL